MTQDKVTYNIDEEGKFEIGNYNWSKPLSSFLPGIAGIWGMPSWCYFVNRGQLICSLGVQDKDGAILEFLSFNQALNLVEQTGFRTFIRKDLEVYEPFRKAGSLASKQTLKISPHELELEDQNQDLGLRTRVQYFPLVESPTAGLVRIVSIKNMHSDPCTLEIIDGAARLIPFGTTFEHQKVTARHVEALMHVVEIAGVPVFKLRQTAADVAEIGEILGGHFLLSRGKSGNLEHQGTIIDPRVVFGGRDQWVTPYAFQALDLSGIFAQEQISINQTPCAFTAWRGRLQPAETLSFIMILGHAKTLKSLEELIARVDQPGYIAGKREANRRVIRSVSKIAATVSSSPLFDAYCEHTFLDNVIRGGLPLALGDQEQPSMLQVFGRQNADLERDYHWLELEAAYLSQGNGHYRSVLQNRRMDSWFFPWSGDFAIKPFMDLIQLDGYNPLVVGQQRFKAEDEFEVFDVIKRVLPTLDRDSKITTLLRDGFTPGEFALALDERGRIDRKVLLDLLGEVLSHCRELEIGGLHVGYWIDHWLYNFDSIEVFLSIFPDRLVALLTRPDYYSFFNNPDVVEPRSSKTFEVKGRVRRYAAVRRDAEKEEMIAGREKDHYKVHDHGGEIYRTTLLVKLLCMIATKVAALDPMGIGVEMEADKPGWNDSLNGLPGMFGSSLCQSLALIRALRFLISALEAIEASGITSHSVYQELADFIINLTKVIAKVTGRLSIEERHRLWDERHGLLEIYRAETRLGVNGRETSLEVDTLRRFLQGSLNLLENNFSDENLHQVLHDNDVPYTYLRYEAADYQSLDRKDKKGWTPVQVQAFESKPVAMFLEGAVHYIRAFPERAIDVYEKVRASELFDQNLGMFRVCEPLGDEPPELGRITAYPPGWIEHASIYTHMSFKWMLELLRAEQYDAFFDTLKASLPPYLAPEIYGRSPLENSSFIVSSVYLDSRMHGQAFQPRLSGVTAEWLQIWTMMTAGKRPFRVSDSNELILEIKPILPGWLFTEERKTIHFDGLGEAVDVPEYCFAFRFLGHTLVIYKNPSRRPTFGSQSSKIISARFEYVDGREINLTGSVYEGEIARDVRAGLVKKIDVSLA